jgi:hypothetical protein
MSLSVIIEKCNQLALRQGDTRIPRMADPGAPLRNIANGARVLRRDARDKRASLPIRRIIDNNNLALVWSHVLLPKATLDRPLKRPVSIECGDDNTELDHSELEGRLPRQACCIAQHRIQSKSYAPRALLACTSKVTHEASGRKDNTTYPER